MTSDTELFGRDSVKLNILKELKSGNISISLAQDGGEAQDYISRIRREGSRVQVFGKFNISEDPSGEVLTIRPITVSGALRVTFGFSGQQSDAEKKLCIFRSATKTVERQYDISEMLTSIEFIPQGNVKYLLRLTYGGPQEDELPAAASVPETNAAEHAGLPLDPDVPTSPADAFTQPSEPDRTAEPEVDPEMEKIQAEIKKAEEKLNNLRQRRQSAKDMLSKLESEYEKDYGEFASELEEYRLRYGADQSVIDYYRDNDIQPIEELLKEISDKLEQAEKQISVVILGRQKKTMEIENEVKSNKRQ